MRNSFDGVAIHIRGQNPRALPHEGPCNALSKARSGPGDDCGLSLKSHADSFSRTAGGEKRVLTLAAAHRRPKFPGWTGR